MHWAYTDEIFKCSKSNVKYKWSCMHSTDFSTDAMQYSFQNNFPLTYLHHFGPWKWMRSMKIINSLPIRKTIFQNTRLNNASVQLLTSGGRAPHFQTSGWANDSISLLRMIIPVEVSPASSLNCMDDRISCSIAFCVQLS